MDGLIKPILASTLLISSIAAPPAKAENNEIGRVILGVVGIATLAAILDKRSSKAKQKRQAAQVAVTPKRQHVIQPRRIDYQQCLRQRWTQSGWQSYVSNRCVNRLNREAGRANPHGQKPRHFQRGRLARH